MNTSTPNTLHTVVTLKRPVPYRWRHENREIPVVVYMIPWSLEYHCEIDIAYAGDFNFTNTELGAWGIGKTPKDAKENFLEKVSERG